jgi:hypothetical protein
LVPSEITVTTSVARRGLVSARVTRIGLTVGQDEGATVAGLGVPPGVVAPGVVVPFGVAAPGVLLGLADPSTGGDALSTGIAEPDSVSLGSTVGVRRGPPAQPARTRAPATRIGARRRRAGFMTEA